MARSEGGLCGFPIYRHTTTAPKTSECSSIVSMQYVWKIYVISILSKKLSKKIKENKKETKHNTCHPSDFVALVHNPKHPCCVVFEIQKLW